LAWRITDIFRYVYDGAWTTAGGRFVDVFFFVAGTDVGLAL